MADVSREIQRAAHRRADQQRERIEDIPVLRGMNATVSTVTLGAGTDGGAVVTVTSRGGEITVACYGRPHIPSVGDRVTVLYIDGQPQIVALNGGFPPEQ